MFLKEIKNVQVNKATQDSDIPTKLVKGLFADFISTNLNDSIVQVTIPSFPKLASITPVHAKT